MNNSDRHAVSEQSLSLARQLLLSLQRQHGLVPGRRFVVGVAGESGSGKSVVATSLAHTLRAEGYATCVLHQDDYFVRPPRTNHEYRMLDIPGRTGPHEVQLGLIAAHLAAFRREEFVDAPVVNYPENRFDRHRLDLGECDVLIVEGTYALGLADLDARIFLTATHDDTAERRRLRNRDIDDPRIAEILQIEHQLIAPQAAVADLLIDRDYVMTRR